MRIRVNPARPASSRAVYANPPDPEEMRVWQRLIRPGDKMVDVGANIGLYTLLFADLGARVTALEPVAADELRLNVELNGVDVEIVEAAASDTAGRVSFSLGNDQENSIVPDGKVPGNGKGEQTEVESVRLDDIIDGRPIRGVKVDVEGFERLVLAGADASLRNGLVDVLQLEWNRQCESALGESREPVAALLESLSFRIGVPQLDGSLVDSDGSYQADETIDLFAVRRGSDAESVFGG